MKKTITVKGIGTASARPDYVVLSMNLESRDMDYEKAMETAASNIHLLNKSLEEAEFAKDTVKTTNFNVHTDYDNVRQKDNSYQRIFRGYVVNHDLKVEFDFESKRLTKALAVVGACLVHPQLSIRFTVKDATAVSEEMLRSATVNARRKAEILCEASGAALGELVAIDYNWGELNVFSNTRYEMDEKCLAAPMMARTASIEIEPDDIETSDTVTFVWEISKKTRV